MSLRKPRPKAISTRQKQLFIKGDVATGDCLKQTEGRKERSQEPTKKHLNLSAKMNKEYESFLNEVLNVELLRTAHTLDRRNIWLGENNVPSSPTLA
ncbi:hypothetical protein PoB_005862200 [Plakobranchus ocellatus]|uniref:Uncharacterized protein n=1 Tax=Plakobranchus ocellatus TaxID=259542 RepID=A0AAV4CKY9_9GAST|nr:hypothetical protein PoB_005862200 [Plakobranchus ocellatus]